MTLFENASTRGGWLDRDKVRAFLTGCELILRRIARSWFGPTGAIRFAGGATAGQAAGHPRAVCHGQLRLQRPEAFQAVDYAVVPSEFSRRYYRETLGLACQVLPNIVNWRAARCPDREPRYLTFHQSLRHKGVYVFAHCGASPVPGRTSPLLVTQGRSRARRASAGPGPGAAHCRRSSRPGE